MNRSVVFIVSLVFLLSIGCDRFEAQKPKGEIRKVTLGLSATSLLPALVHIASKKGYFQEEGIDLEIEGYPTGKDALEATLAGEVDIGTVADVPLVLNSFERNDFNIFATIVDSANHVKILGRKDRGINNLQDLLGKKIATTIGTTAHFFMDEVFVFGDMDYTDIELINRRPKEMTEAIVEGEVDAIFTWEPNITNAKKALGENGVVLSNDVGYRATFNLVAMKSFINAAPEVISGVLRGLIKAEDFMLENREESIDIVASYLKTKPTLIASLSNQYIFRVSLSQAFLYILENEARWAVENKLTEITDIPNYLDYLYIDSLDEIKPSAVSIIH